ncbi:MAG TPA: YecA family protein, partial [Candidatus Accumulibacter sp.]|nr:YecA family protein [Accumulibacter sp.]
YAQDEDENSPSDYVPWCQAYLHGIDSAPAGWFEALGANDDKEDSDEIAYLDEQLFPLFMLTGDAAAAAAAAGEEWLSGRDLDHMRNECEEKLPQAVTNIYRFWVAQRSVRTFRHEQARIGRNEPCPCGSGMKYKRCCGTA